MSRPVIVSNLCIKICKKNRWIGYVSDGDCVQLVYKNIQKKIVGLVMSRAVIVSNLCIKICKKIVGLVMSRPVTVSNLCIKTSNIGRKIIKTGKVRFFCV